MRPPLRTRATTMTFAEVGPDPGFGKPAGYGEAGGGEERMLDVDAVVDDGDLHAFATGARRARERGRAEHRRPAVQAQRVRVARVDAVCDLDLEEIRQPRVRDADGEAVDEHLIAPGDGCLWDLLADARDRLRLRSLEPSEVRARERRRDVQLDVGAQPGKPPREGRRGERRIVERHDDAYAIVRGPREAREVGRRSHLLHRLRDDVTRACDRASRKRSR